MVERLIPGINALYGILKRDIERQNQVLEQRKGLADELTQNCRTWAKILLETFDEAVVEWSDKGKEAAMGEIEILEMDFIKLDYWSLKSNSPILLFLSEDKRFAPFADSCADFYKSALYVKRLVYGGIEASLGRYISLQDAGIKETVEAWQHEVEQMLETVTLEYHKLKTILPK